MKAVLADQNFGSKTSQVEASLKKHEAISADIESRVKWFIELNSLFIIIVFKQYTIS